MADLCYHWLSMIDDKAVVVGGSNGIGLAIALRLIELGYFVHIFDIVSPEEDSGLVLERYEYHFCDLRYLDDSSFSSLVNDKCVKVLMITAGFGRVCHFESLHISEVQSLLQVNTVSCIKILSLFYSRILSKTPFYSGIMCSIAGLVSSPLFSVYAASKAALFRFTESVNAELEMKGTANRILCVAPGSVKGTKFNNSQGGGAKRRSS